MIRSLVRLTALTTLLCFINSEQTSLLPNKDECGDSQNFRIFGGQETDLFTFPWMALLEYNKGDVTKLKCGGTLINKRYILTAAHCVVDMGKYKLTSVRLAEHDTETEEDCFYYDFPDNFICSTSISVPIEDKIIHEKYDYNDPNHFHDIALLRLNETVNFTEFIKPICLPLNEEDAKGIYTKEELTAAGWGSTNTSDQSSIKLYVKLPSVSNSVCNRSYNAKNVRIDTDQLCAGGKKGEDACVGDSGGPLMTIYTDKKGKTNCFLAGIVSYGPNPCGTKDYPGVYTKVFQYLPWILSKLRE